MVEHAVDVDCWLAFSFITEGRYSVEDGAAAVAAAAALVCVVAVQVVDVVASEVCETLTRRRAAALSTTYSPPASAGGLRAVEEHAVGVDCCLLAFSSIAEGRCSVEGGAAAVAWSRRRKSSCSVGRAI